MDTAGMRSRCERVLARCMNLPDLFSVISANLHVQPCSILKLQPLTNSRKSYNGVTFLLLRSETHSLLTQPLPYSLQIHENSPLVAQKPGLGYELTQRQKKTAKNRV